MADRRHSKPVARGDWNHLLVALGVPGSGKSTWALARAIELNRQSYVLVHDPQWSFPLRMPDGRHDIVTRHESLKSALAAIGRDGHGIHSVPELSALTVLDAAEEVADRSLERHEMESGVPVTVILDEGVLLMGEENAKATKAALMRAIVMRRHLHMGLIVTCQHANLLDYKVLSVATELALFRTKDDFALLKLRQAGVPEELLGELGTLGVGEFVLYRDDMKMASNREFSATQKNH